MSIGNRETMPQPMSAKAPKVSRWVILAFTISPGTKVETYSLHAQLLGGPAGKKGDGCFPSSFLKSRHKKADGTVHPEMTAISRTLPSFMPMAPSSRGINPRMQPQSTTRLWLLSQITALPLRFADPGTRQPGKRRIERRHGFQASPFSSPLGKFIYFGSTMLHPLRTQTSHESVHLLSAIFDCILFQLNTSRFRDA